MNTLKIFDNKRLQFVEENSIYITENKIQSFNIIFPTTFGDYHTNELECEMRVYLSDDEYMGYAVSTASGKGEVPITNDITEKVQTVKIIFFFTKDGNVIGKTNAVEKKIEDAPYLGNPLTPRAQFDEVISEQRQTISEQSQTIENQGETITQQTEQITELNGEVTELSTENTRLEALTDTQRETIQNMLDNPPQPKLYTPPIVTPSGQVQQITAPEGYDGLSECTVDRVTAEVDSDIQPENIKEGVDILGVEGTYNPFPEHSVGGIYITETDEDTGYPMSYLIENWNDYDNVGLFKFYPSVSAGYLDTVIFKNCNILSFSTSYYFLRGTTIKKIVLPDTLTILGRYALSSCSRLENVDCPQNLKTLGENSIESNPMLKQVIINHGCETLYYTIRDNSHLKTVNIPNTITSITGSFSSCGNLEFVTIENSFNCNGLNLSTSTLYSVETIVSWLEALADRTGETAYTLTMGTTNLNKLTAEQKAIATNKNWNLA